MIEFRDYVDSKQQNVVRVWLDTLPPKVKAKINYRIMTLAVAPLPWRDTEAKQLKGQTCKNLWELRVPWKRVQYRPLCRWGPGKHQMTILLGATEQNGRFVPRDACVQALNRWAQIGSGGGSTCEHDVG